MQKNVKNAAKYKQNYSTKDKNLPFKITILLGILSSSYQIKQEKKIHDHGNYRVIELAHPEFPSKTIHYIFCEK